MIVSHAGNGGKQSCVFQMLNNHFLQLYRVEIKEVQKTSVPASITQVQKTQTRFHHSTFHIIHMHDLHCHILCIEVRAAKWKKQKV